MGRSAWLAPRIAWRYLLSKKKHGAVGVITWISVAGVAVATAATICVLSVFNGFRQVLTSRLEQLSADCVVLPDSGRTFAATDSLLQALRELPQVADVCPVVEDRALAVYAGQEMPVRLMGIDTAVFRRHSRLDSLLIVGTATFQPVMGDAGAAEAPDAAFSEEALLAEELDATEVNRVVVSAGVGSRLGIPPQDRDRITIIAPRREGTVNLAHPAASLQMDELDVEGIYQAMQQDMDKDYIVAPLGVARELLSVDDPQVTAINVYARPGTSPPELAAALRHALPKSLTVKDRLAQHESEFRMANIEKWITYLLLSFIMVIASFNLISSLAMLVIDKQENLGTLHALGASRRRVGAVFAWESGLVTVIGAIIGMALGAALALLQQHCGLIKLNGDPGTLIVDAYPVRLLWSDLLYVAMPLAAIGLITALLTARFARTRL